MRLSAACAVLIVVPLVTAAPAYAVDRACVEVGQVDPSAPAGHTGRASAPYDDLRLADAQSVVAAGAPARDRPVRVAVLGPGVLPGTAPVAATRIDGGSGTEIEDPLGTEVAGLVAGPGRPDGRPVGFAPAAEVVDVRVYVDPDSDSESERPSAARLASGLRWVAGQAAGLGIEVAVVPFAVRRALGLGAAVREVQRAGVVLVAATGDRPDAGQPQGTVPPPFPAGYPGVVAVNSSGDPDGAFAHVLPNPGTTVAAPSYGAVSYALDGGTCVVQPTSTGAAAGEVAGVLALLRRRYPDDTPAQTTARLVATANGTPDGRTPLVGAGVVQPYEALTRPLAPAADGTVERTVVHASPPTRAPAPEPDPDVLAELRDDAVWWGLIGGGLLVIALLLRAVLAVRRPVRRS